MTDALKPCPFCGGEPERLELEDAENFGGSVICCKSCGASSPVHFDRKENLRDSWNRRSSPVAAIGEEMVQRAAKAISIECNKDDLPDGGWMEYHRDCARAALTAALSTVGERQGEAVAAKSLEEIAKSLGGLVREWMLGVNPLSGSGLERVIERHLARFVATPPSVEAGWRTAFNEMLAALRVALRALEVSVQQFPDAEHKVRAAIAKAEAIPSKPEKEGE